MFPIIFSSGDHGFRGAGEAENHRLYGVCVTYPKVFRHHAPAADEAGPTPATPPAADADSSSPNQGNKEKEAEEEEEEEEEKEEKQRPASLPRGARRGPRGSKGGGTDFQVNVHFEKG